MFEAVAALPPGEAEKERKTLFKTVIGTLNHVYVVDLMRRALCYLTPIKCLMRDSTRPIFSRQERCSKK
jgi:hypothetical protein